MASFKGHHIPGTPFTYKHGWVKVGLPDKVADYEKTGGFSRDPEGRKPESGYMVSKEHSEMVIPKDTFDKDPAHYIGEHAEKFADELTKADTYQGAWTDNGNVYLDVSKNPQSVIDASNMAIENHQLAVADVAKMNAGDYDNAFPTTADIFKQASDIRADQRTERMKALVDGLAHKDGVGLNADVSPEEFKREKAQLERQMLGVPEDSAEWKAMSDRWALLEAQYENARSARAEGAWAGGTQTALEEMRDLPNADTLWDNKATPAVKAGFVQGKDMTDMVKRNHAYKDKQRMAREVLKNEQSGMGGDTARRVAALDAMKQQKDLIRNANPSVRKAAKKKILRDLNLSNPTLSIVTPYQEPTTIKDIKLSKSGKIAFWKQILPKKQIEYTAKDGSRQKLNFDEQYLMDLANSAAVDKVGFLLAPDNNSHTMDPERWRGEVAKFEVREDGLYGKIVFPNADAARAVLDNPSLGVSARIREGVHRSDGTTVPRGIIHILGTLDPQVSGMSDWQTADLSASGDQVLDLTNEKYEEPDMGQQDSKTTDKGKALVDYTEADIEAMTEDELDEFLAAHALDISGSVDTDKTEVDETKDEVDTDTKVEDAKALVGAGADMSTKVSEDIELANSRAEFAQSRANEALRRLADAQWKADEAEYLGAGVPPHLLDLAKPILNRPDDMVIDLSNSDEDDVNASEIVRGLLEACKGMIDLSNEAGHSGTFTSGDGEDPDAEMLTLWESQSQS